MRIDGATPRLWYVTHPDVAIDPAVPVPEWTLSERGWARARALLGQSWLTDVRRVVSSSEGKALDTAGLIAGHLGLTPEVRPTTGELDRRATGFVPAARHEELADRCFAEPERSAAGWERAVDAQRRIAAGLADLIHEEADDDVVVVGHGGVGTLWLCHLDQRAIDRRWDQPGQGHVATVDRRSGAVLDWWRPFEELAATRP